MHHFDLEHWADYVRGAAAPEHEQAMREHLGQGCAQCSASVRQLEAVGELAATERLAEPPAHLLRFAKATFSLRKPETFLNRTALAAKLLFSTGDLVSAAGVRGLGETVSRQTLYEAGDYSVHLKFEHSADPARVSLIGQVANRRAPAPPLSFIPVLVSRGRRIVARALSNEFGEFQLEYGRSLRDLELHIPVPEHGHSIKLLLGELGSDY